MQFKDFRLQNKLFKNKKGHRDRFASVFISYKKQLFNASDIVKLILFIDSSIFFGVTNIL